MINDADPESSIPDDKAKNANPLEFGYLLQDLLVRAEDAKKDKDFQAVIRYYRAIAKGVPDRAKGWGKLCEAYEVVHDRDRAIHSCKYAIERDGAEAGDFVRYVGLIVSKPDELTADERKELVGRARPSGKGSDRRRDLPPPAVSGRRQGARRRDARGLHRRAGEGSRPTIPRP